MDQKEIDRLQQKWIVQRAVGRCLHIGCGMKRIPGAVNLDPNPNRFAWTDVSAEGMRLPFADGTFDSVVSSHVLPLFADINAALREMARVLKPGGTMAHVVPDLRYAPSRASSRWKYEKQYSGWDGPESFRVALQDLGNILQFTCIENFAKFNWSFKVEATRL